MGRIRCSRWEKSRRDIVTRAFALIALIHLVLHRVSCVYEMIPNAPKHYATHQNMSLGSNGVDWVRSVQKIPSWLRGTNFYINCSSSPCFASSLMRLRNHPKCTPNTMQRTKTWVYGAMGWIGCVRWKKIPMWLHGTNFCINCTSSPRFAPSFM